MIVVTTENIPGFHVKDVKGEVFGLIVRSRGLGGNILAGLRTLVGGEIHEYTTMLEDAREKAIARLKENAQRAGGNAVVMMRFDSSAIGQTMSEVVAYGTAVIIEQDV
ncbi:MAG: YbjQ family protein [Sporolactobacillus sp.]